ncbi:hypothetical protein BDR26DRAFT_507726 [Obelidium mucronatum]|nr:hypothetical protein BDR26DRAFT_507726 [Obelidium mucronatum]
MMTLLYAVAMEISSVFLDKLDDSSKYASLIMSKSDYVVTPLTKVFLGSCSIFHFRKGEHAKALDRFQDMINSGMTLMTVGQKMPMQLFGFCAIFPFLYFGSIKDKDADAKKIQGLIEAMTNAINVSKKLWLLPCVEGAAAYRMYLSAQLPSSRKT